jgi:hypothetical protein
MTQPPQPTPPATPFTITFSTAKQHTETSPELIHLRNIYGPDNVHTDEAFISIDTQHLDPQEAVLAVHQECEKLSLEIYSISASRDLSA